ncbi:MAG: carboxylesterase family protein [Microbacterium sp.]
MPSIDIPTHDGILRGIDNAGVMSFLGVPYGQATGGENRFRGPQPVQPWEGVREALAFGPAAPQVDTRSHAAANGPRVLSMLYPRAGWPVEAGPMSEDCLRLDVWAPSGRLDDALPVLVWLHGGGFTHGSGNEMAFNGDVLAQAGELVVVTVTHRLGITGFLDLRDDGLPESADAGMLDIVAALEWVQRNIRSFGGDPSRVTVSGQSGGSAKVAALHGMPAADGLFAGAIMMSGPFTTAMSRDHARAVRDTAVGILGASDVEELRSLPLERLLDAQAQILARQAGRFGSAPTEAAFGFGPAVDETHLPEQPFARAVTARPLMIGWTTHEAGLLLADAPEYDVDLTGPDVVALIDQDAPGQGATIYADLERRHPAEPAHLRWSRWLSTRVMAEPAVALADRLRRRGGAVWAYEFAQTTEVLGGLLGACHSLDLAYVFGTVDRIPLTGRDPRRIDVSRDMMRAWASFCHDGDPGWTMWNGADDVQVFGAVTSVDDVDLTQTVRALPIG